MRTMEEPISKQTYGETQTTDDWNFAKKTDEGKFRCLNDIFTYFHWQLEIIMNNSKLV